MKSYLRKVGAVLPPVSIPRAAAPHILPVSYSAGFVTTTSERQRRGNVLWQTTGQVTKTCASLGLHGYDGPSVEGRLRGGWSHEAQHVGEGTT